MLAALRKHLEAGKVEADSAIKVDAVQLAGGPEEVVAALFVADARVAPHRLQLATREHQLACLHPKPFSCEASNLCQCSASAHRRSNASA